MIEKIKSRIISPSASLLDAMKPMDEVKILHRQDSVLNNCKFVPGSWKSCNFVVEI